MYEPGNKVTTTFAKGDTIGGDDVPSGYVIFDEPVTVTGTIVRKLDEFYEIAFDEPLPAKYDGLTSCFLTQDQLG